MTTPEELAASIPPYHEFTPRAIDVLYRDTTVKRMGLVLCDFAVLPPDDEEGDVHWTIIFLPTGADVRFCGFHKMNDAVNACRQVVKKHSAQFNMATFHREPTSNQITDVMTSLLLIALRHNACKTFVTNSLVDLMTGDHTHKLPTHLNKEPLR